MFQRTSPLPQQCISPSSTLQKVCSHGDQAHQHHGYSRTLWSHLNHPQCFFFLIQFFSPFFSHLLVKAGVVLTSAINDHGTLTSSTVPSQHLSTQTCPVGNVNPQFSIIYFLTRSTNAHFVRVQATAKCNVCIAWGQFRHIKNQKPMLIPIWPLFHFICRVLFKRFISFLCHT